MRKIKVERTDTTDSRKLLLKTLGNRTMTINECIDRVFTNDIKSGKIEDRTWKFYVHLNKLFSPMERKNLVTHVNYRVGPTGKNEKTWKRS